MFRGLFFIFCIALVFHLLVVPQDLFYGLMASILISTNSAWLNWNFEEDMINLSAAIAAAFTSPAEVRRRMHAYRLRDPAVVMRVCTFAVREHREQITAERERALGEDSEWARKREAIRRAADGANRAVTHWHERTREEPGGRLVEERLDAASGLSRKLTLELAALDEHAEAVGRAYDECRGTVDAMERRVRDVEQIRELGALSDASEGGQALARESVKEIAETLLEEAESVGAALAELSRLELKTAPEAASDNIEQLAEEVAGESEQVSKAITDLDRVAKSRPLPIDEPRAPLKALPESERSAPIEAPKGTPKGQLWAPAQVPSTSFARSTSPEVPARMSQAEEEREMKELVVTLRRMADVQERRAHDLRYRDEYNSEADDREELAEKMTDLADEIEMFWRVSEKMKEWTAQNPLT